MIAIGKLIKYVILLLSIISYKSIPFAYFFRFYWVSFQNLVLLKKPKSVNDQLELLRPKIFKTHCSLFECDFYLHKSNSTYFADLDVARTDLLLSKLQKFFLTTKQKTGNFPMIPVGSVTSHYKKEIRPMASYVIISEIFAWDEKWIFMLSKFMIGEKLCCLSITKSIFKDNYKTVSPKEAFTVEGIYNEKVAKINEQRLPLVKHYINELELLDNIELFTTQPHL